MTDEARAASQLVYHRDRLGKLRSGITRVLDALAGALQDHGPLALGEPAEMTKTLQEIEETSWSRIREHFLDNHRPSDGLEEGRGLALLLLDFTNKLDDVKEALEDRLRNITLQKDSKLQQEVRDLQNKLAEEKTKATDLRWKHQELSEVSSSEKHYKGVLQQQLKEKQELIAQLQRNGTVQLWEKEKDKLLEGSRQREEDLTRELTQLRVTHEDMRDRLQNRIKDLEDKVKLERMRDVFSRVVSKEDADVDSLKRQLYAKEVDISRLEQELANQQRHIVGCIKGIQRDFRVMGERQEERRLRKGDMEKMNAILEAILAGAREARLDVTKADLPLHYISLPEDIHVVAHPGKRISRPLLAPVVTRHLETIGDSPETSPTSSPPGSPKLTPHRVPSLDLPHPSSCPSLSSAGRSSTPSPSPETSTISNGHSTSTATGTKRLQSASKTKISVDEVGLITKVSPRGGLGSARTPSANSPGRSPRLTRKDRTVSSTATESSARSSPVPLVKRRTVSTPVPPPSSDTGGPKQQHLPTGARELGLPRPPSRSPSPRGRMATSARKPRGSSKLQAGNGSFEQATDEKTPGKDGKPTVKSTVTAPGEFSLDKEHPDLIDKETGLLDVATARVCFPHMTEDQIKEHCTQFKKYDTNGDYNLDFVEMTQAIQSTVADYYKPRQVKEAMVEIDVDQSGTVDFYEYLGISTMLIMKVGKSEIFRSSMVRHAGGSISKVCSVQ